MTDTTTDTTSLAAPDRIAMRVIAGLATLTGSFSVGFGVAHVVELIRGEATVPLLATGDLPGTTVEAKISTVDVQVAELSDAARGLFVAGTIVEVVTGAIVTVAAIAVLLRIAQGQPFHRSLFRTGVVAGFALLIGGMVGTGLRGLGQMEAAFGLNGEADGPFEPAFTFAPGVWWLAFVVLALALVFRIGSRLQRDTQGLV